MAGVSPVGSTKVVLVGSGGEDGGGSVATPAGEEQEEIKIMAVIRNRIEKFDLDDIRIVISFSTYKLNPSAIR
jgi:hypothetical protein